jgi:predicted nucleic acid-binding protein
LGPDQRPWAGGRVHRAGEAILFLSDAIVAEVRDVPLRPELTRRYPHIMGERVEAFVEDLRGMVVHIARLPRAFTLPRDSRDEPYTDLAIAVKPSYLVTWNERHLTYLMRQDTAEGQDFCRQFPDLVILTPPAFLEVFSRC